MVICPLCEHPQSTGSSCEVCGRSLVDVGAAPAPIEPVPGLEPTRAAPVDVQTAVMADLEATRFDVPAFDTGETAAWRESDRAAATEAPLAETIEGLEQHRAEPIPGGEPDPFAQVLCRYCRSPLLPGERLCGNCGMKIQVFERAPAGGELATSRCPECGDAVVGTRCRRCGARFAPAAPQ